MNTWHREKIQVSVGLIADKISECAGSEWRALLEKVKLTQETPGWLRDRWEGRQRLSDASRRSETKSSSVLHMLQM